MKKLFLLVTLLFLGTAQTIFAQSKTRVLSGFVVTKLFEAVPNAALEVETLNGKLTARTDDEGKFFISVPADEPLTVTVSGSGIKTQTRIFASDENTENVQLKAVYQVAPISESVTIEGRTLSPEVEFRNQSVYENTLFGRDDQIIQTLNAGINAGQHEGGGKSLEIRRFGFNLDHGGVNGGLKVLVDNVQQNQGTQGHGQGYLGALKSLSPELVEEVNIVNGPFSAVYGDFSGLGVVHIKQRESLENIYTARLQGGSFDTARGFFAFSPKLNKISSYIAFEPSFTNGAFINPLGYRRDNATGNLTYKRSERESFGAKFNFGRNRFTSSGQIPLDLVERGELDRFGFLDADNGGRVKLGTGSVFYRRETESGRTFKADGFLSRSLFDLWSNFTFFLQDPIYGDEIQQHDSRLQQGINLQVFQPYILSGNTSLLTIGGNFHANQINVGLSPSIGRNPNRKFLPENIDNPDVLQTSANAKVNNYAVYAQNGTDFFNGHLHIEAGLRLDVFTFDVEGFELSDTRTDLRGRETAARLQPKFGAAWSPFEKIPTVFYFNYGRGISSQDARGVVRNADAPKISTTDFYQTGVSFNKNRFSVVGSFFFIDRSNEQVYIPDDGSIELAGKTRSNGFEWRSTLKINRFFNLNGGLTQVFKAFYRDEFYTDINGAQRRVNVDSAPHTVANASVVLSNLKGFNSSLNYRHISNYRLDGTDENIRAAGHDVFDFSASKRLRRFVELNLAIDNLFNRRFYETQNYFESRIAAGENSPVESRIHATPALPRAFTFGVTFRFGAKN